MFDKKNNTLKKDIKYTTKRSKIIVYIISLNGNFLKTYIHSRVIYNDDKTYL